MVRYPALRCDLAGARRRVHIVVLVVIGVDLVSSSSLVLILVVVSLLLVAHGGLALRDSTCDAARTKVTPIRQVLEAHLSVGLGVVSVAGMASAHIKS